MTSLFVGVEGRETGQKETRKKDDLRSGRWMRPWTGGGRRGTREKRGIPGKGSRVVVEGEDSEEVGVWW